MPSVAEVQKNFPDFYEAYSRAVQEGKWKPQWGGIEQWGAETIQNNPGGEWAIYANTGKLPERLTDVVAADKKVIAETKSYEQELFDQVNRDYIQPDLAQDAERRTLANTLTKQATTDYTTARDLAGQALGPSFNADAYFAANPDVAEAYARQQQAPTGENNVLGGPNVGKPPMTAQQFAQNHYETTGKAEGRQGGEYTSRLQREVTNADQTANAISGSASTAATEQIAALEAQIGEMRASQDVNQIARASALQQQVDALRANVDQRANDQVAALDTEIAALRQNLDAESQAKATALQQQRDALWNNSGFQDESLRTAAQTQANDRWQVLSGEYKTREDALNKQLNNQGAAINTRAASQLSGLQAEIAAMRGSLDQSQQQKADALEQQLAKLTANIDSYDSEQQAALTQEITKLAAAQLPVSQARVQQAENMITGINVGLEQTRDQFASDQAAQGFIGGSSSQNGNLARAVVGARQQAAQTMGDARIANALDDRTINSRGATEGRSISNSTAGNRFALGEYGANTGYADSLEGTKEARRLADELASGTRSISDLSAQEKYALDTYGNQTAYDTTTYIAGEGRKIGEETAADMRSIADNTTANRTGILNNFTNTSYSNALSGAAGNRAIGDTGAADRRSISDTLATDRAAIGAGAANTAFADRIMGADDTRSLSNAMAAGKAGVTTNLSTQQQATRDAAAGQKNAYFDADYTRQLGTALTLPSLTTNYTASVNALDQYKNAGLNRSLDTLNWWAGGGTAPANQTAQYQAYVDQTGSNIAGLGTGLLSAAGSFANSRNWWQTPTTPVTDPSSAKVQTGGLTRNK